MIKEKNQKLLTSVEDQILEQLVDKDHAFRKLNKLVNFRKLLRPYKESLYSNLGPEAIDLEKGFKALMLQFWEDYSDREMEKALKENVAIKWFCGFDLLEPIPDFSYFSKLRKRLGTETITDLLNKVNQTLADRGLFGNVFKFIDASSLISKTHLWEERDRAIADGEEKLNNANVENYAADNEARWGAKSKNNIWFGYKRHNVVDMKIGLIDNVLVTPANVLDFQVMNKICPKNVCVFMDKLYDTKKTEEILLANNCHSATIRKNNNPLKNKSLDRWRSSVRMPFEGVFARLSKKTRYRGIAKTQTQCLLESICFNLKKAIKHLTPALSFN